MKIIVCDTGLVKLWNKLVHKICAMLKIFYLTLSREMLGTVGSSWKRQFS